MALLLEEPTEAKRPRRVCFHCGSPLLDERSQDTGFCCPGCAYVHRLIAEYGLKDYYKIKDAVVPPADAGVFQPVDLGWLVRRQNEAEVSAGRSWARMDLNVQGISCAACVWLIEQVSRQAEGVREVSVDAVNGILHLEWQAGEFDASAWGRKLHSLGYALGPAGASVRSEASRLGRRIGLCVAFSMNVMLFTLPSYFGMRSDFPYAGLFGTLSMFFATMSVLVGGTYFATKAVASLKLRRMHIDLPIALGIFGAYAGSMAGWFGGDRRLLYFDFVGTFTALMLVGRWAQIAALERNRRRLLQEQPAPVEIQLASGRRVAREGLEAGDIFLLEPGQTLPVDAQLQEAQGQFSLASINGEAEPRTFWAGALIPAGAVNVARLACHVRSVQAWKDSFLSQVLKTSRRLDSRTTAIERVVQGYVAGIIALSILSFIVWGWVAGDWWKAGSIGISVLVVSCPCAIGLALPFADELAMAAAKLRGVFVKEPDFWGRLAKVKRIVFDKTGTLTLESPVLLNSGALPMMTAGDRGALGAMVQSSLHPVSQCLWEALLVVGSLEMPHLPIEEIPSCGLRMGAWTLGRAGWADEGPKDSATVFAKEGRAIARFYFTESIRPNAREEIAKLSDKGYEVSILSGDHSDNVTGIALSLGVPADHALGGLSAQAKAEWIETHQADRTLMLGDGLNDTLAFEAALCRGTPVIHRGQLEGKADFYYLRRGIDGIGELMQIGIARKRTQRVIVIFSIIYNLLAAGFAVAGYVTPLLAAVLMPASSIVSLSLVGVLMRNPASRRSA